MRNTKHLSTGLVLTAVALTALWLVAGCDDGPTEPKPVKDYAVYFNAWVSDQANWFFRYHPLTNAVDSFWLPYWLESVVSADGKTLYVSHTQGGIAVLDTDSMMLLEVLQPYLFPIAVSPDNRLMAVYDPSDSGLSILNTSDYSLVFHDTTQPTPVGVFSASSQRFYGAPNSGGVYVLDLSDSLFAVRQYSVPFGSVVDLAPSPDESKLYLYLMRPVPVSAFAVRDMVADSFIFYDTITWGWDCGELEPTPDGQYVFYTDPNTFDDAIRVYDVQKNQLYTTISVVGVLEEPYLPGIPLRELVVTPDGRWLVALPAWGKFAVTVDIRRMAVVKYARVRPTCLWGLTCQNAP
ncbi:MAG: hypothetical protein AB1744_03160 [Candidatus Zixiibacteriota bacterium]